MKLSRRSAEGRLLGAVPSAGAAKLLAMGPGEVLVLAVGLAADAMAVAAARGMTVPRVAPHHVLRVALFFGGFQALMPLLGWMAGARLGPLVASFDHWIAFVLLSGIGGKMMWDARQEAAGEPEADGPLVTERSGAVAARVVVAQMPRRDPFGVWLMLIAAVATSIDALGAGFALPMLDAPKLASLLTIGITTAVLSVAGLYLGRRFGSMLGRRVDLIGGAVLIALGAKILFDHWTAV